MIGYSGHSFVACDALLLQNQQLLGYFENEEKQINPYNLQYLGSDRTSQAIDILKTHPFFIGIGNNAIRAKIFQNLFKKGVVTSLAVNAIHPTAVLAKTAEIGGGTLIAANATINPLARLGNGVICNTGCIIEHECTIHNYAHIAPGATLAGNVTVGKRTFVGANSVVKQGIIIGDDVTIGAGTVVLKDVPSGTTMVGNPGRILHKSTNH